MPIYRSVADIVIDTSTTTPEEAARPDSESAENGICVPDKRKELFASVMKTAIPSGEKIHLKKISGYYDIFLYGILGYPCLHSKSPGIYNHLFADYGMPAHYTWFEHKDPGRFLSLLPGTGVRGLSVTIPHKETVIPYPDDHMMLNPLVVNTILIQDEKSMDLLPTGKVSTGSGRTRRHGGNSRCGWQLLQRYMPFLCGIYR